MSMFVALQFISMLIVLITAVLHISLLSGFNSTHVFPKGSTNVTYSSSDPFGNIAYCTFTVTISDEQIPDIFCPHNITQHTDPGLCSAAVPYTIPSGSDNCMAGLNVSLTSGLAPGATFPHGLTVITYSVIDASGNSNSCSFTVYVPDLERPHIMCQAQTLDNIIGFCFSQTNYTPSVSDNCFNTSLLQVSGHPIGGNLSVGTAQYGFVVRDGSNNTNNCVFSIHVLDIEPPVITCGPNVSVDTDAGKCTALVNYPHPVIKDNCPHAVEFQNTDAVGNVYPVGQTIDSWLGLDTSGNQNSCEVVVIVDDVTPPQVACPRIALL